MPTPHSPGVIPSLFVACETCRIKDVCKVYGQCEMMRAKAERQAGRINVLGRAIKPQSARIYGTMDEDGI